MAQKAEQKTKDNFFKVRKADPEALLQAKKSSVQIKDEIQLLCIRGTIRNALHSNPNVVYKKENFHFLSDILARLLAKRSSAQIKDEIQLFYTSGTIRNALHSNPNVVYKTLKEKLPLFKRHIDSCVNFAWKHLTAGANWNDAVFWNKHFFKDLKDFSSTGVICIKSTIFFSKRRGICHGLCRIYSRWYNSNCVCLKQNEFSAISGHSAKESVADCVPDYIRRLEISTNQCIKCIFRALQNSWMKANEGKVSSMAISESRLESNGKSFGHSGLRSFQEWTILQKQVCSNSHN
ncbi:hypothetical protein AVEN_129689-1 [Araneus ventricosus]|uniref:Uncharacterized protein n=1 Tax=Araneus ventricosus TaxID=182803 RepID=A0A4Y2VPU5_ARAVE|nr:hypothetical protein AVEN_129689-1 [Araneus ventricosus]